MYNEYKHIIVEHTVWSGSPFFRLEILYIEMHSFLSSAFQAGEAAYLSLAQLGPSFFL
jgi:hypothetical protein